MVTNLSASVVSILYNFQLMSIAGENGVAAYGVIMYVNIIFMAIFLGYSIGSAPIVSYHYGAENHTELKSMFRKSLILLTVSGVILVVLSELVARPLVMIFTSYDPELLDMTASGFHALCPGVSSYGFQRMGLGFFYRFKQRSGFRLHLLSSHSGFPDYCGSHAADSFGY